IASVAVSRLGGCRDQRMALEGTIVLCWKRSTTVLCGTRLTMLASVAVTYPPPGEEVTDRRFMALSGGSPEPMVGSVGAFWDSGLAFSSLDPALGRTLFSGALMETNVKFTGVVAPFGMTIRSKRNSILHAPPTSEDSNWLCSTRVTTPSSLVPVGT